jgi:hypothetical protein
MSHSNDNQTSTWGAIVVFALVASILTGNFLLAFIIFVYDSVRKN